MVHYKSHTDTFTIKALVPGGAWTLIVKSSMIHPESQEKNVHDTTSDSVETQYSISGFIVNILLSLFWIIAMWFCYNQVVVRRFREADALMFCVPLFCSALIMLGFHLYVLFNRNYGIQKEDAEISLSDVFKNHWAVISGTCVFYFSITYICWLFMGSPDFWENKSFAKTFIFVALLAYAISGMVCWGFVTTKNKNILARIVRPWQIRETTEVDAVRV